MKIALLSVYNKDGIVEFAKDLLELDYKIYASGGTAKILADSGVEVTDVAEFIGGGAILGHRVVTLSREIYAGLLARDVKEDIDELDRLKIPRIDLVCVDLYPLTDEIAKWQQSLNENQPLSNSLQVMERETNEIATASIIEKTDIGGPTLLRAAAKGRRIVVCDSSDRAKVVDWIKKGEPSKEEFLSELAAKAEYTVANYCLASARYHSKGKIDGFIVNDFIATKYGENAWQVPAGLLVGDRQPLSLPQFKLIAGTEPSYNNWADVDRMLQTVTHLAAGFEVNNINLSTSPSPGLPPHSSQGGLAGNPGHGEGKPKWYIAVGVKHGNPCGAAVAEDAASAIEKMLEGDLRAIFGGLVMVNFEIDEKFAEVLLTYKMESGRRLLDGIVAPSFTPPATETLKRKGDKCRFFENKALLNLGADSLDTHDRFRYVRGGFLKQPNYTFILDLKLAELESSEELLVEQKKDILLAWAVGSTSNSNTVTIVKDGMLLGNGVGQQDRVGGCELAIKRARDAGHDLEGATAYSDSFFPFPDGPKKLIEAGIKTIFATRGSVKDEEVKKVCVENGVTFVTLPDVVARGFYGH